MIKPPLTSDEQHSLLITEFLLGYSGAQPHEWRYGTQGYKAPRRLASPFSRHLREINRFLFDGGWKVDVAEATPEDPRQLVIDKVIRANHLESISEAIWERGAATGGILLWFYPDEQGFYKVCFNDRAEYQWIPEGDFWLISYPNSEGLWCYISISATEIRWYPKSPRRYSNLPAPSEVWVHNYPFIPAVEVKNRTVDPRSPGFPEFDGLAQELALEILIQSLDQASNYHFFGNPFFISPDPLETLRSLKQRVQVLQGSTDKAMQQELSILDAPAMPEGHPDFLRRLEKQLAVHLGSSWVPDEAPPDTSSLTLRLLYDRSISTANRKWEAYAIEGFEVLFNLILQALPFDGILATVDSRCHISHKSPSFEASPAERLSQLAIADQLTSLGIRREVALQEFFTNRSAEEILELLEGT